MEVDLSTNFLGIDKTAANEAIQANQMLLGSYLNLADAMQHAGVKIQAVTDRIEELKKVSGGISDAQAKELVETLGELQIMTIDDKVFEVHVANEGQILKTIDNMKKLKKEMDKTTGASKKTGKQTEKTWKDTADGIGNSADKAIMAIDSVSGAFGGASSGLSGVVGDVVQLIKNPMTAAIAGAGVALMGVVEIGKQLWDEWNLSLEEAKTQAEFLQNIQIGKRDENEKNRDEDSKLIDRLKEIGADGISNNLELVEVTKIIDALIEKLVKLGHTEDELRSKIKISDGKILGLDFAEIQFQLGATAEAIKDAEKVVAATKNSATKAFQAANKTLSGKTLFTTDTETADVASKVKHAEDITTFRFDAKEKTYVTTGSSITEVDREKEQVEFEKQWNKLMDEKNFTGVMDLLQKRFEGVKTGKAQEEIQRLYEALKNLNTEQEKLNSLNDEGAKDQASYFAKLAKQTREFEKTAAKASKSKKEDYEKRLAESKEKARTADFTVAEEYTDTQQQKDATTIEITKTNSEIDALNGDIVQAKKHLDELAKKTNEGKIIDVVQLRQATQKYQELLDKRTSMENKVVDLKTQQLELSEKMAKIEKDAQKYTEGKLKNDRNNRRLEYFSAKGDWKKYNEEKLRIEIENSGQHLTDEQKKDLAKNQQYNNNMAVWGKFTEEWKKLYSQALKVNSPNQAAKQGMIDEFSKLKGGDLSKGQLSMIDRLVQLQTKLTTLPKLDLANATVKTNQLTSRGGWKGGAVAPNVNRVNQLIASNTQTANSILTQIKQVLNNGLKI